MIAIWHVDLVTRVAAERVVTVSYPMGFQTIRLGDTVILAQKVDDHCADGLNDSPASRKSPRRFPRELLRGRPGWAGDDSYD